MTYENENDYNNGTPAVIGNGETTEMIFYYDSATSLASGAVAFAAALAFLFN